MLLAYHHIFSVEEDEHRETALVQLNIDTVDAFPKRQSPRRIPFAARREVPQLLEKMQKKQPCGVSQEERWVTTVLCGLP